MIVGGQRDESRPAAIQQRAVPDARPSGGVDVDAAQGQFDTGEHQAEHQGLVVDAGDQVEQQQRVRGAEPQRAHGGDPAASRQPRQRPHDQRDADQREEPVHEDSGDDVVAGERR